MNFYEFSGELLICPPDRIIKYFRSVKGKAASNVENMGKRSCNHPTEKSYPARSISDDGIIESELNRPASFRRDITKSEYSRMYNKVHANDARLS